MYHITDLLNNFGKQDSHVQRELVTMKRSKDVVKFKKKKLKRSEAIVSELDKLLKIPEEPSEEEKARNGILDDDEADKRIAKAESGRKLAFWFLPTKLYILQAHLYAQATL